MTISFFSPERYFPSIYDLPFSYRNPDRLNACPGFAFCIQIFHGGPMWASAPTEHNDAWRKLSGASRKSQKRCQWQKKRGDFEEVPRLAGTDSACQSAGTTVGNHRPLRSSIGKRCVGAGFYPARGRPQGSPLRAFFFLTKSPSAPFGALGGVSNLLFYFLALLSTTSRRRAVNSSMDMAPRSPSER